MLDPHDAALAGRDPGISGLSTLLDPEALGEVLSHQLPALAGTDSLRSTYVRYKPGANCLVGYDLNIGTNSLSLYAKAFASADDPKLCKALFRAGIETPAGPSFVVCPGEALFASFFPNDAKLPDLWRWFEPDGRRGLASKVFGKERNGRASPVLESLAYKPERRYVARLQRGAEVATIKVFRRGALPPLGAARLAGLLNRQAPIDGMSPRAPVERLRNERRSWVALQWLEGRELKRVLCGHEPIGQVMVEVGAALVAIHRAPAPPLPIKDRSFWMGRLSRSMATLHELAPHLTRRVERVAAHIERGLEGIDLRVPIHGDFYAKQVLVGEPIGVLDFDQAALGAPAYDLACFLAHLDRDRLRGDLRPERAEVAAAGLLDGYAGRARDLPPGLDAYRALCLLQLAADPFRKREPEWRDRIEAVVAEAEACPIVQGPRLFVAAPKATDAALPGLEAALDPRRAQAGFERSALRGATVLGTELLRLKPGRRALVAYSVIPRGQAAIGDTEVWLAKVRRRGVDRRTLALCRDLWEMGFQTGADDGIEIPEPLGAVDSLGAWFQRSVPGLPAEEVLQSGAWSAADVGARLGRAIAKLHACAPPVARTHLPRDEITILDRCLAGWTHDEPWRRPLLVRLQAQCHELARWIDIGPRTLVHRDFHPGQALLGADGRVWLIDLDLCAMGPPALDVGNFIAHLIELGVRQGDPDRHLDVTSAFADAWRRALPHPAPARAISDWATLSLVRLAALSRTYPDRRHSSDALLDLCLQRLGTQPGPAHPVSSPRSRSQAGSS